MALTEPSSLAISFEREGGRSLRRRTMPAEQLRTASIVCASLCALLEGSSPSPAFRSSARSREQSWAASWRLSYASSSSSQITIDSSSFASAASLLSPLFQASAAFGVPAACPGTMPAAAFHKTPASTSARLRSLKAADSRARRLAPGRGGFPAVSIHMEESSELKERMVITFSAARSPAPVFSAWPQSARSSAMPARRFRSEASQPDPSGEFPGQVTLSFSSPECPSPPRPSRTLSLRPRVSGGRAPVAPMLKA